MEEMSLNKESFQHYDEVYDFIQQQKSRVYELNHFHDFMEALGNPQNKLKVIHIGGTNGKGSTTNYIRAVLQGAGYKVGTFTTPALGSRLEVIRVNNCNIDEYSFVNLANEYKDLWVQYELSVFEIEMFISVMYFISENIDYAIYEVGLGGTLDATNIVSPLVCVNTNIGMDHVDYLGHTYTDIAKAKAGIVKDGIAYITGEKKEECLTVFRDVCNEHHSPLLLVQDICHVQVSDGYVSFDYRHYHVILHTAALYQSENCALAIEVLLYLREHCGIHFDDETMLMNLKETIWQGRFEVMHHDPLIMIDGAHNLQGMKAFYHSAKQFNHIKVIFSALRDKDTHAMLELLLSLTDDVTVTEFDYYRAQTAKLLAEDFPVKIDQDWKHAVDEAYHHDGVVFITGSLYFISQVREYMNEKNLD